MPKSLIQAGGLGLLIYFLAAASGAWLYHSLPSPKLYAARAGYSASNFSRLAKITEEEVLRRTDCDINRYRSNPLGVYTTVLSNQQSGCHVLSRRLAHDFYVSSRKTPPSLLEEAIYTVRIENELSKKQILTVYTADLNHTLVATLEKLPASENAVAGVMPILGILAGQHFSRQSLHPLLAMAGGHAGKPPERSADPRQRPLRYGERQQAASSAYLASYSGRSAGYRQRKASVSARNERFRARRQNRTVVYGDQRLGKLSSTVTYTDYQQGRLPEKRWKRVKRWAKRSWGKLKTIVLRRSDDRVLAQEARSLAHSGYE